MPTSALAIIFLRVADVGDGVSIDNDDSKAGDWCTLTVHTPCSRLAYGLLTIASTVGLRMRVMIGTVLTFAWPSCD
jgi:hypothetical protein